MRDELLKVWNLGQGQLHTLLDLGCRDCWHTAGLPGVTRHVGVDAWSAALKRGVTKAASGGIPHFEPVDAEALCYMMPLDAGAFDAVLAIDLLEHIEPQDAEFFANEMARVARRLAVAWTTFGMIPQGPYDVDGQWNPLELHQWGPTPEFFATLDPPWQLSVYPDWHEGRGGAILAWLLKG